MIREDSTRGPDPGSDYAMREVAAGNHDQPSPSVSLSHGANVNKIGIKVARVPINET
jgi:hypothetical protein